MWRGVKPRMGKSKIHRFDAFPDEEPRTPCGARLSSGVCPNRSPRLTSNAAMLGEGSVVLRHRRHACRFLLAASVALAGSGLSANDQGKLEARYTASLAGIPLGSGIWVIDIAPDQYTA